MDNTEQLLFEIEQLKAQKNIYQEIIKVIFEEYPEVREDFKQILPIIIADLKAKFST